MMSRFRAPVAGVAFAVALAAAVGLATPADATSAARQDDPSWADVLAARGNAAAAQAQLQRIAAAVAALQTQEDAATAAQLRAASDASAAADALAAAQAKLDGLDQQLDAAKKESTAASARFVATAVQMSRTPGGNDLTAQLIAATGGSSDLLGKLSSLDQLGRRSAQLEATARQKKNLVSSLEAQAATTQKLRASLKADADTKLAAAQAAQAAAQQAVAAGEAQRADLQQKAAQLGNAAVAVANTYAQNHPPASSSSSGGKGGGSGGSSGGGSSGGGALDTSGVVADPAGAKAYARSAIGRYGWGGDQFECLVQLWNIESGWRANAYNRSSGAYGIPQALPANKMASAGADWLTNGDTQIDWGLGYINAAYGTPCKALSFETSHVPYWY